MASRKPIVLIGGLLWELPPNDGVSGAVQLNTTAGQTLDTLQQNQIAVDSATNELVVRIGDLIWRFQAGSISSYAGQLKFSIARNSHWIGAMF